MGRLCLGVVRGLIVVTGLAVLWVAVGGGADEARAMLSTLRSEVGVRTLVLLALAYAVALAMPFVPGLELGLLIMVVFGPTGVVVAYVSTLAGLGLSYAAGRFVPARLMTGLLRRLGSVDAGRDQPGAAWAGLSASRIGPYLPRGLGAWLLGHRYLALAVCLNLPCNTVIGGGGGLALLCGMSGRFCSRRYLLTVALATAPIPLLMLTGVLQIDGMLR